MISNARPVPVLDSDSEMRRHELWRRVAQLRSELQLEPSVELHRELDQAIAELRSVDSHRGGDA